MAFNATCAFSDLAINYHEPVRAMYIEQAPPSWINAVFSAYGLYVPATIMAKGIYDDYGGVEWFEGEAERFEKSCLAADIDPKLDEDRSDSLTPRYWLVMIREDAFPLMRSLEFKDFKFKTIGDKIDSISQELQEELSKPIHPIRFNLDHILHTNYRMQETHGWKLDVELKARICSGEDQVVSDLDDLYLLGWAMNSLRKTLHPSNGAGSQDENLKGYTSLANYILKCIQKRNDYYDENW